MVADTALDLSAFALRVRRHIVRMVYEAKSGHIGGSMSSTEIMAVLYGRTMRHDPARPDWPERDRLIMSKGHCTPVLYATLAEFGYLAVDELKTFRRKGSRLQGHAVLGKPEGVENSAGALGMGLSFGLGIRLGQRLSGVDARVYVLMGDGEQDEGQVWEAAMAAAHHNAEGLVAIIDRNGIQNDDFTAATMRTEPLAQKYRAFGWEVHPGIDDDHGIDGHDLAAVEEALTWAGSVLGKPACVIFDTVKGKGVSFMENNPNFHGAPPSDEQFVLAMQELGA
ncbi:MAG: transketolase [Dehalococcoidia bacterium]|nr:transketolase [Dehalococcoidia bacterium]